MKTVGYSHPRALESLPHRRHGTQCFGELFDDLGKDCSFGSRNPFEVEPLRLDARELEEPLVERQALGGTMIATNIVAVAQVSAQNQHTVGTFPEGPDYQLR